MKLKTQEKIVRKGGVRNSTRKTKLTASPEILSYIKELQEFLECDMPTKIFPKEILKGEEWVREDNFKDIKEIEEYLTTHFDILKKQIGVI